MSLLSTKKAADYIGVHSSTLIAWEDRGLIQPKRIGFGKQRRYTIESLDSLIEYIKPEREKPIKDMIPVRMVMEKLNISRQTIYRWRKDGKLIAYDLAGKKSKYYKKGDIQKLLDDRQNKQSCNFNAKLLDNRELVAWQ